MIHALEIQTQDEDNELDEDKWLRSLSVNPAFDFLKDEAEDIYTLEDGQPFIYI
jgi:hypothetical protein